MELIVEGLHKTFEGAAGEPSFTLDLPSLKLRLGTLTFVLGHNGSGKSVFLKLLCGQLMPTKGAVTIYSNDRIWKAHKHQTAIVRQQAEESLSADLTVRENLLLRIKGDGLMDRMLPSRRLADPVRQIVGQHAILSKKLDQSARHLSGGQKQTLAFLAVTIQNSKLLCLDEFLAATDHSTSAMLRRLAREYADQTPACVLIASHGVDMALNDADRILILKEGKLCDDLTRGESEWDRNTIINQIM